MNTQIVGTARLVYEPTLAFSQGGLAYCRLRLAFSNSRKNKKTDQYEYTPGIFVDCTVFGGMAENAAESLVKGDEVIVSGELEKEEYESKDGEKRDKLVLQRAEVAPSIRRAQVAVKRAQRGSDSRPASNGRPQGRAQRVDDDPFTRAGAASTDPPF